MLATRFSTVFPPVPFSRTFDRMAGAMLGPESPFAARAFPGLNAWETDDAVIVEAELPGFSIENLEITMTGKQLTISGARPEMSHEGRVFLRRERPTGEFTRVLRLSTDVDAARVGASLENGVLTVTLPKAETAKPRKIQVTGK